MGMGLNYNCCSTAWGLFPLNAVSGSPVCVGTGILRFWVTCLCYPFALMDRNYPSPVEEKQSCSLLFHLLCDSAVSTFALKLGAPVIPGDSSPRGHTLDTARRGVYGPLGV